MGKLLLISFAVFPFLLSCSKGSQSANDIELSKDNVQGKAAQPSMAIQWYEGSIDEAFTKAKKENTPLFLYWGAEWCPPCNQLKATIFKRRDFIEQTQFFIPVYLDGDTESAQRHGEKFVVKGYPTLIIFSPSGEEITRIPGGMELNRYQQILKISLQKLKPVEQIIQAVMSEDQSALQGLKREDYQLLAYYSWSQDHQQTLTANKAVTTLQRLYLQTPTAFAEEKSRLFMAYLAQFLESNKAEEKAEEEVEEEVGLLGDAAFRQQALQELMQILNSAELSQANALSIRYEDGNSIRALTADNSKKREQLITAWRKALHNIAKGEQLSTVDKLGSLYGEISLDYLQNAGKLSQELREKLQQKITEARHSIANSYEHSAVLNMIRNILVHGEMPKLASKIMREEVKQAKAPFYLMLELADFAKQAGDTEEALSWYQRAYEESEGRATRFQWGVSYLLALIELTPQDATKIQAQGDRLINYLLQHEDGFYNRNVSRLKKMEHSLLNWSQEYQGSEAIAQWRKQIAAVCHKQPANSAAAELCVNFLSLPQHSQSI